MIRPQMGKLETCRDDLRVELRQESPAVDGQLMVDSALTRFANIARQGVHQCRTRTIALRSLAKLKAIFQPYLKKMDVVGDGQTLTKAGAAKFTDERFIEGLRKAQSVGSKRRRHSS
jgi:hypothetical protein